MKLFSEKSTALALTVFTAAIVGILLLDPSTAQAQLVDCQSDCGWEELVTMFNRIIEWLIIISTSVAALLFMYAGFLYLTSRGDESQVKRATTIFTNVAIGFAIMLLAWLLVDTIVKLLTGEGISAFAI